MRLGAWQLAARSVVFVDAERNKHFFALRARPDGAMRLEPRAAAGAAPHLCVLSRALVYRRSLHSPPATPRGIETLLRSAAEYFPAGLQPLTCCIAQDASGASLCALPRGELDALVADLGALQGVLVGGDAAEPAAILAAIERRHRVGTAADLASQPVRLLPVPRVALAASLAALITVAAACAALLAATYPGAQLLARELAEAEAAAGDGPRRYESISRMLAAQRAVGEFRNAPGGPALDAVMALLESTPPGHSIVSVELKNGQIKLTGIGPAPLDWLGPQGVPPAAISTYRLQQLDRFTAQFPAPRTKPPARGT